MKRLAVVTLVVCAFVAAQAPTTFAQKKKNQPSAPGTLVLNTSSPSLGDAISFTWSVAETHLDTDPLITVRCWQNGGVVYGETYYASQQNFVLGGVWAAGSPGATQWMNDGGAADCEAVLKYYDNHPATTVVEVAVVPFHANGL